MKSFDNKVAAITGAGSGIGRQLAVQLAQQGCHLSLSDIDAAGLDETRQLIDGTAVSVVTDVLDVADRDAIYRWADKVVADHGRVNLIFNNAGVAVGALIESMRDEDLEWLMNINFWGVVHGTRAFLPHLRAAGEGHIVNISSVFGLFAQPTQSAYNSSKFAVRGFTESLRMELDMTDNVVSASCVHPGGIKTNIAKNSRTDPGLSGLTGSSEEESQREMEKMFSTSAGDAAKVILNGVKKNRRRILVGSDAHFIAWMLRLIPTLYQPLLVRLLRRKMKTR